MCGLRRLDVRRWGRIKRQRPGTDRGYSRRSNGRHMATARSAPRCHSGQAPCRPRRHLPALRCDQVGRNGSLVASRRGCPDQRDDPHLPGQHRWLRQSQRAGWNDAVALHGSARRSVGDVVATRRRAAQHQDRHRLDRSASGHRRTAGSTHTGSTCWRAMVRTRSGGAKAEMASTSTAWTS